MQKVLRKRILRDLKANFFRYLALSLMIALSMFLVITIVGSAESLTRGTEKLAEDTKLEDGEFTVFVPLSDENIEEIKDMDVEIEEQFYLDILLDNEDESTIRAFRNREHINKLHFIDGKAASTEDELVLEKRFAEVHDIQTGDTFSLGEREYKVSGICVVSDYDGPFKSIADTAVNSKGFGLAFLSDKGYESLKKSNVSQKSEEFTYAYKLGSNADEKDLKSYLTDITISSEHVEDEFFQEYWERTGGVFSELQDGIAELSEGSTQLLNGLSELEGYNGTLNSATDKLFDTYLKQVNDALSAAGYEVSLTKENFNEEFDRILAGENSSIARISLKNAKKELDMLAQYQDGVSDYTGAVSDIKEGAGELNDGIDELRDGVEESLGDYEFALSNLTLFLPRSDNPRIFATKNDKLVDIEVGLAAGVIVLILIAYVISVFVVHSIESESSIIGTLYAMGVTKNDLMAHYITLPIVITFLSGLAGALLSKTGLFAPMIADSSYQYFSIPEFAFEIPGYLWVYALIVPPVMAVIVNVLVINKKLKRTALSLIRNEKKQHRIRNINLGNMNFVRAFRIRQMLREFRQAVTVVFGMFIALLVMMISIDCYALCSNIADDFEKDTKYEYMYTLKYPEEKVPDSADEAYAYTCKKDAFGYSFDVTLLGIHDDNPYFDVDIEPGRQEVCVSSSFAEKFLLKQGDEFVITDKEKDVKYAFSVKEIIDYAPAYFIFMDIDSMRDMFSESDNYYNVLFSNQALDIPSGRLYSTTSRADTVKGSTVFSELMMPMVSTLMVVSALLFCVVLYLMMKVMLDRSSFHISLIKIFGYRSKEVRKLYLDGNFYVIAIGGLVCIPLTKLLMNSMFPMMVSNVACGLNLKTPFYFYIVIYAAILLLYFVINKLLVRRINAVTPAEVLKNRE